MKNKLLFILLVLSLLGKTTNANGPAKLIDIAFVELGDMEFESSH